MKKLRECIFLTLLLIYAGTPSPGFSRVPESGDLECIVCERIHQFSLSRNLVGNEIWPGMASGKYTAPLLYYTDSFTFIAFDTSGVFADRALSFPDCPTAIQLTKIARLDTAPFHMENKMNFSDTFSEFYFRPMMLCSDVETLIRNVPDFSKTEDWIQLVMHEYFHSYQFSHKPTILNLSENIKQPSSVLDEQYLTDAGFRDGLAMENQTLLDAIRTTDKDTLFMLIKRFIDLRETRRRSLPRKSRKSIVPQEDFWETIEGTARYVEYYLAGNFREIAVAGRKSCDTLFQNFAGYSGSFDFELYPEFIERTRIMKAYYYVTGFNLCRLLDKLNIDYKTDLFDDRQNSLYDILRSRSGKK